MNSNIKIAFFDTRPYDIKSFEEVNKKSKNNFKIKFYSEKLTEDTVTLAKGADAVCVFVNDTVSSSVIDKLVEFNVKLVALRCAGFNNVDLKSALGRIKIVRVPAYSPYAVAEHALALMMTLNRKIHRAYYRVRDNNFNINGLLGFDMYGKTAGVVGTGKIGRILINILKGLGMKILAYDLYPDKELLKDPDVKYTSLEDIYKNSDIISLHCPLTKESFHMINSKTIDVMKPDVMLINTSRGHLINTKDLIAALKQKRIGSAGLDVYEEEADYFFEDLSGTHLDDDVLARLLTFHNVIVTSHQAFFTEEALENIAGTTIENIRLFLKENTTVNEICHLCPGSN